jgi:hypothetical protein
MKIGISIASALQLDSAQIVALVCRMLESVGLDHNFELLIRGRVSSRDFCNDTIEVKNGDGVRLAVQTDDGLCHECFLTSLALSHKDLYEFLTSKLVAGMYRKPDFAVIMRNISESRRMIDNVTQDLYECQSDIEALEKKLASRRAELVRLGIKANQIIQTIHKDDFHVVPISIQAA